jgi:hypothetical protein
MLNSLAINQYNLGLPRLEKPEGLIRLENKINFFAIDCLNWQAQHPTLNALTKIAGGLLLVAALKATPSSLDFTDQAQHFTQGLGDFFNNLQPHVVSAGDLHEQFSQTLPPECGMPDTLTVHSGDTFSGTVRGAIVDSGVTGSDNIKDIYNQIVSNNATNIPDPTHIHAGTIVNIPDFQSCDAVQEINPAEVIQNSVNAGSVDAGETSKILDQAMCEMPDTVRVDSGQTFFSTVRNAIKDQGITDPTQIKTLYDKIVAHNVLNIPDPAHIGAGTVVNIPTAPGCENAQTIIRDGVQTLTDQTAVGTGLETETTPTTTGNNGLEAVGAIGAVAFMMACAGGFAIWKRNH